MNDDTRQHSDPLLPLARQRFQELSRSAGFPSLALGGLMFCLAFLFGGTPDVDFGFGSPYDEPEVVRTTVPPSTATSELEAPTTTAELVSRDQLQASIVAAGFPAVDASVDGSIVTLIGTVPDQASADVVVQRVLGVEGVTEVVDQLEIQGSAGASAARIDVSRSSATIVGVVDSEALVDRLVDLAAIFYRSEQIDIDGLVVDADAAPLTNVMVSGSLSDADLIQQMENTYRSFSSLQVSVELEQSEQPRIELLLDELLDAEPIEFELGQASVTSSAATTLDKVAEILGQFPNAAIEVGGHTDGQGGNDLNQELSQERAAIVIEELRDRGVEIDLVAVGYGSLRPRIFPEQTEADQAANRRIEFRLQ